MDALDLFFTDTVSVETFQGESAYGGSFAAAVTVPCYVEDAAHLVVSQQGEEVVSQTTIYAAASWADTFIVQSKVTVGGREARVITQNNNNSGPNPLPHHLAAHLT